MLILPLFAFGQTSPLLLSLEEALRIAHEDNPSLNIARQRVESAKADSRMLNAMWYPTAVITGEYAHSTTPIEAVTTLGEIGGELLGNLGAVAGNNPLLAGILDGVTDTPIRLPLVPRNTAEVGAEVAWTVFSGGRRVVATRIAKQMVELANDGALLTANSTAASVVAAYMGVELAARLVEVREQALSVSGEHLREARRLEAEGMIPHAERVAAEVAHRQSGVLLASVQGDLEVARCALATLLAIDSLTIIPTTPLCLPSNIPTKEELLMQLEGSPTLSSLRGATRIASLKLQAERSRYLPSIALIGHQQLWSSGLDKNLFPRTFVGVGLSWTLFDGLAREGAIASSKSAMRSSQLAQEKTQSELRTAIEKYYSIMTTSLGEYKAQRATVELAEELLRMRHKAFVEGMATSAEVIDASHTLSEAKLATLASLYSINTSLATLLMLTGRIDRFFDFFVHTTP